VHPDFLSSTCRTSGSHCRQRLPRARQLPHIDQRVAGGLNHRQPAESTLCFTEFGIVRAR
jgi:hypothetical protein